jgi:hypothetical protein
MCRLGQRDFARLIGALFGVAVGAALALGLACLIYPPPAEDFETARYGLLEWVKTMGRNEGREMAFFFLTLMLGGGFGWAGASRYLGGRRPALVPLIFLAALVPSSTLVIGGAMTSGRLVATAYAAAALAVLASGIWLVRRWVGDTEPGGVIDDQAGGNRAGATASPIVSLSVAGILCVLIMAMFVVPVEATSIAAFIGFEMHMASFMIGPATYSFAPGLVPGIDYFTQYSVGTPWLFSFFLAPTATGTMVNAVWFVVAEILVFQISLLVFLRWFLRSWPWALVVGLGCLMLQFGTSSPLYAPSSTSARYPLLIVCVMLFVHWIRHGSSWPATLFLAAALSAAMFLNTETGVYICAATAIVTVAMGPGIAAAAVRTIVLGATTLVFFLVWNVIAFGPGILQFQFLLRLADPLILYTGGFVSWPIEWSGGYHWIYNIVSPGIALASVVWAATSARLQSPPCPRSHLGALAMMALVGLFMTAKYINMSIVGLWQVNAICLLVVIAWWMRALVEQLPERSSGPMRLGFRDNPRSAAGLGLTLLLVLFLWTIADARNPSLYAIPAYRTHPSLVNYLLGGPEKHPCGERPGCSSTPVSPADVALIDSMTKPSERVALLAFEDWTTLIEAKRASKFHFLPSAVVFTERQLEDSLRDLDLVFLPRYPEATLGITNPDIARRLVPMLKGSFKVVAESPTLLAWRRVGGGTGKP